MKLTGFLERAVDARGRFGSGSHRPNAPQPSGSRRRRRGAFQVFMAICTMAILAVVSGCADRPTVVHEGVLWSVRWTEAPNTTTGLYRSTNQIPFLGGSYGIDMYGVLYPTCLEIRFPANRATPIRVIPLSNILDLQFGDGGVMLKKE